MMMRWMFRRWMFIIPLAIVGFAAFIFIGGEIVRLLWNWLFPPLFGWREIGFWQAIGLLALCRILFGSHFGSGRSSMRRKMGDRMRERMTERAGQWERMTPEERERFRQGMRGQCGFGPSPSESPGQGQ